MYFNDAKISNFIIHSIQENYGDKEVILSEEELSLDADLTDVLRTYFFKKFEKPAGLYQFFHEEELSMNEVFTFCQMIFEEELDFLEVSKAIANFLYTKSKSNAIKTGEVYIVKIKDVLFEDQLLDGIGIFKSENKDTFLKVFPGGHGLNITADQGININKLDKGAIILNADYDGGYVVGAIDNTNKQDQAKYWIDDFLKINLRQDNYNLTQQYIDAVRGFATDQMEDVEQVQKIDFIQRSFEYLNEKDQFNASEFEEIVLQSSDTIEGFKGYVQRLPDEYSFDEKEEFEISKPAMKNNKRYIRSVIKLDKNFHIYVHGRRDRIEKGMDEGRQLHYYKVYFEDET